MQIRSIHKAILFFTLVLVCTVHGAIVTRVTSISDGSVLYASDLNSEFNNIINNINNLDNDNLSSTAAISPAKISATVAGDGLGRDGGTGVLSVNVDASTIETSGDTLQVKANGITDAKLRQSAGLSVIGNSTNATANVADITAGSDGYILRRSGTAIGFGQIVAAGIATNAVETTKINNSAVTSVKIQDGTIATDDIADGAVTAAKKAALNYTLSSSSGSFSTSSSSDVTVTNLSVSITTAGRPVEVKVISDAGGATTCDLVAEVLTVAGTLVQNRGVATITRDGTNKAFSLFGATVKIPYANTIDIFSPCSSLSLVDFPAAGTYTYAVKLRTLGADTVKLTGAKLLAYEL